MKRIYSQKTKIDDDIKSKFFHVSKKPIFFSRNNCLMKKKPIISPWVLAACIFIFNTLGVLAKNSSEKLGSPDNQISIIVEILRDTPVYSVWYNQHQIILPSTLGLELKSPINGGFKMISKKKGHENSTWIPLYGEKNTLPEKYNSVILNLRENGEPHRLLNIEFRAYNEGIAFRYIFPEQQDSINWHVKRELSEFRFSDSALGFPIYNGEATFQKVSVPVKEIKTGAQYPLTVNTGFGYASILEAYVVNYPRLKFGKTNEGDLVTAIMDEAKINTPFSTPWRAIIFGKDEGKLIENEFMVLNLNPPCSMKEISWIQPGKTISNEGSFPLKTVDLKKLIDFASENGFKYMQLDWGWYGTEVKWTDQQIESFRKYMPKRMENTEWEENTKANPFTVAKGWVPYGWQVKWKNFQTYVDLDLKELIRYGKTKQVGICLYIEAGKTLRENNMDSLFSQYEKWGIAGIKPGFVQYGSQENTEWIRNMVSVAAQHKLWVCIHDRHVPDGMERTFPNLFSVEGGGGAEGNHPVVQDVMLPFTRCLAGPFDYTPFIYKDKTTNAHMMAFLVVYYNPSTVIRGGYLAWNGNGSSGKGGDEIEFLKRLPSSWDDTKVLKARIGEYLAIARRSGNSWYIGSITGNNAYTLEINLNFLEPGKKYKATLFIDDPSHNTPRIFPTTEKEINVVSTDKLKLPMEKAGGCAIILDEI